MKPFTWTKLPFHLPFSSRAACGEGSNRHANLIQALTEFYTLFVQLAYVPQSMLYTPDFIHGITKNFNASNALAAGFTPDAVHLMARLPYLDAPGESLEIMPSTNSLSFVDTENPDVSHYEGFRDIQDGGVDDLVPGTTLRLTWQNIYGTILMYDTETCEH